MSLIRPFHALRPAPEYVRDVIAPPYDVLTSAEARTAANGKLWSFLHISKAEIDLPQSVNPYAPEVYAKAAENLRTMLSKGVLARDPKSCYYLYRLRRNGHTQTGLVATASVAAYRTNRIRRHEHTMPAKEEDRMRQIDALNAQTGPVLLAYPPAPKIDALLAEHGGSQPEFSVVADDVEHAFWIVSEDSAIDRFTTAFDDVTALYIADGHHRTGAAARIADMRGADPEAAHQQFLSVIFPAHEMRILDYNRVVADLNGLSADALLKRLAETFVVESQSGAARPATKLQFGMYLAGQWYRLVIKDLPPPERPAELLDANLLTSRLLNPVLGVQDIRTDPRVEFVGGGRGLIELERRVDNGEMAVAFALYPPSMVELMSIADAADVMPPKSTWFEPKLADGLVSHVLD